MLEGTIITAESLGTILLEIVDAGGTVALLILAGLVMAGAYNTIKGFLCRMVKPGDKKWENQLWRY